MECFAAEMSATQAARASGHNIKTVRNWYDRIIDGILTLADAVNLEAQLSWVTGRDESWSVADSLPINKTRLRSKDRFTVLADAWVRQRMETWSADEKCDYFERLLSDRDLKALVKQMIDPDNGRSDIRIR